MIEKKKQNTEALNSEVKHTGAIGVDVCAKFNQVFRNIIMPRIHTCQDQWGFPLSINPLTTKITIIINNSTKTTQKIQNLQQLSLPINTS